jgi:hypothetical protein
LDYDTPKSENQRKFCEDYVTNRSKTVNEKLLFSYKNNYTTDKVSDEKILEKAVELKKGLSKYITYLKKRSEVKDVLTYTDNNLVNTLEGIVKSHQAAVKLLYLSEDQLFQSIEEFNEKVIFFDWMGVQCKSMLDRIVIDHTNKVINLVDIKTTSNLGDFSHSFDEFAYYRQMAFYWGAILNEFKYPEYTKETYIVALQKGDLPECRVFNIEDHWLQRGLTEIEEILPKIKWHYDNNQWEYRKEYYDNNGIEIL